MSQEWESQRWNGLFQPSSGRSPEHSPPRTPSRRETPTSPTVEDAGVFLLQSPTGDSPANPSPAPPADAASPAGTAPFSPNAGIVENNNENYVMGVFALRVQKNNLQPKNTYRAYDPKIQEWKEYCNACYSQETFKYGVKPDRLFSFMFYQCMRNKRPPLAGGRKGRYVFDVADYKDVMARYKVFFDRIATHPGQVDPGEMPEPDNPLQADAICQYRAAVRWLWSDHLCSGDTSYRSWEEIWSPSLEFLVKNAKRRAPAMKKKNYGEKLDHEFAPYQLVEHFGSIEQAIWNRGATGNKIKSAFSWMRHRYCFLHSTHGILRCESIFKGELSDCLMLNVPGEPHKMKLLVQQLATGKTNQDGRKFYGRVLRHKNPLVCGVGAFAMYLALRFHITREFESDMFDPSFWFTNSTWFDVKLLVDAYAADRTKELKTNSYGQAIKSVLQELKLPSTHFVHIGRKIGPKELEMLEATASEIDQLGNWATGVREQRYSGKLPMEAIKLKAGFRKDKRGNHFNVRQQIEVPLPLLKATPLAFAYEVEEYMKNTYDQMTIDQTRPNTAQKFIDLLKELNVILLQDLACIIVIEPERNSHPIFTHLNVFHHHEWPLFVKRVERALEADVIIAATAETLGVEQYVPGIMDRFQGITGQICSFKEMVETRFDMVETRFEQNDVSQDQIRGMLLGAAGGIIDHYAGAASSPPAVRPITVVANNRQATTGAAPTPPTGSPRAMAKYSSLSQLWSDWENRFLVRETAGPQWRSDYSSSEAKHLSRVKQIYSGMKEYMKRNPAADVDANIESLDAKFNELRCQLHLMVKWFQSEGLVFKHKPRGRKVRSSD